MRFEWIFLKGAALPVALALGIVSVGIQAQPIAPPPPFQPQVEQQRQAERDRALRAQQERMRPSVRPSSLPVSQSALPSESPCVRIERITLTGELGDEFQFALSAAAGADGHDSPIGRCVGSLGVGIVTDRVQRAIIDRGFVTTRVLVAPQKVDDATLALTVLPGRVSAVRFKNDDAASRPGHAATLFAALPVRSGDVLNVRDIEQGIENLKRPATIDAEVRIEPARDTAHARPGDSDLVVDLRQRGPLRATLNLDDTGTRATGKTQAGAVVAWDSPLGLSDLFYVGINGDVFNGEGRGTSSEMLHYALPFGYWAVSATASQSRYHQTVRGANQRVVYSGEGVNAELKLTRVLYRDQRRKSHLNLRVFGRDTRSGVDDEPVGVQRRIVAGWELGWTHRELLGDATLDAQLAWRRGTGAFGALRAPEERFGEGTSRFEIALAEFAANLPFTVGNQKLRYAGTWRAQWHRTALTTQDRMAIGGRFTVRGFDGENSLLGDSGWLVRNDIGWTLGATGIELYAGIDTGHVGGPSTQSLASRRLTGGVVGVRGALAGLSYDLFVGAPIDKPEGFTTSKTTAGFMLAKGF